jgi:hypothetical protein
MTERTETDSDSTAPETDSDSTAPETDSDSTAPDDSTPAADETAAEDAEASATVDTDRLRSYLERAVLAALFLFALVAAFRFYFAASNAVSYWVADPYESAFQAAFNLVVLLFVGAAILRQLGRMR